VSLSLRVVLLFTLSITMAAACSKNGETQNQAPALLDDGLVTFGAKAAGNSRFIVYDADLGSVASEVAKNGGQVVRQLEFGQALVANVPLAALQGLRKRFPDAEIFEDLVFELVLPADSIAAAGKPGPAVQPPQKSPWGLAAIHATDALAVSRGLGVKVCVIDTGADKTHPDLQANIAGGRNYVVNKGLIDPNGWNDDNGHGSHVSGTIAALDNSIGSVGVAPSATLYEVKALDRRGSGYLSDITDGIYHCVQAGAQVINMSLGATSNPLTDSPMKTAVAFAISSGVKVVAAAGNEGEDIANKIPAGYNGVIAVAAVDSQLNFASWSNFGLGLDDYTAPGVAIYSTWKSGGYNTISGTSMAAPHVAGVLALQISSASLGLKATTLNQPVSRQGAGLIDALQTVNYR
jgi:subtilisin